MLDLDRSLGVVADLVLYGDHAVPHRVHYLPTRPRLAPRDGGPAASFVVLPGTGLAAEGGAGLLTFTTELWASEAQLEEARRYLVERGVAAPELQRVSARAGKAVLVAALREGDGFVEQLLGEVTADPLGSNRASFSLLLTAEGARLLEAMLRPERPGLLGVRYELELLGLRPALAARVRADYRRIHDALAAELAVGVGLPRARVRASVEAATTSLVQDGAIVVEILRFSDDAELRERVDQTLRWFQDEIVASLFETRLGEPGQADPLAVASTATAAASGAGGTPSTAALELSLALRHAHRDELRTVELDWSQAQAEVRTVAPQGLLADMGPALQVAEVDPRDDFWKTLAVEVRPLGDLEGLGVERLVVRLSYPDEADPVATRATFAFAPGQTEAQRFTAWTNGGLRQYRAQTEVLFASEGPWPGPAAFTGAWTTRHTPELAVHPLADVPRVELELAPGTVSFAETPEVLVDVRIDGEPVGSERLAAASPTAVIRRRTSAAALAAADLPSHPRVEARCTWLHADGGRTTGEWATVEGSALLVPAPWRSRRTIRVLPMLPPDVVDASVTLAMIEGDRRHEVTISLSPTERGAKVVSLPALAEVPPPVRVTVVVVRGDHGLYEEGPFETTDPVVVVRDRAGEHRKVTVRLLAGASLAEHGVLAVQVQQLDAAERTLDAILFTESQREPGALFVPVEDGGRARLRYRVVRFGLDGRAQPSPVVEGDAEPLLVPAVAPPEG